ncbi:hypothetical protein MTBBW1_950003 [Desulfamplus magnetovallimortis]|uniref:J domain-containing protein n=1 Tax=Desulfamplus magnetovallimortis TaxID=1246637 RepID=A0A1W1HL98_9BACT|nr:J domain-containing protein [Desulfamplus magnetovallimortis]SLM33205.1 hypothetical protein MTBBW1_950003 [Desulfamplus magnetovallimortis]
MLKECLVLNIPLDASDEQIRKRYLELVKKYPPEREPQQFQKINSAYEEIKDQRSRVKSRLFSTFKTVTTEVALQELASVAKFKKRNAGLKELFQSAGITNA